VRRPIGFAIVVVALVGAGDAYADAPLASLEPPAVDVARPDTASTESRTEPRQPGGVQRIVDRPLTLDRGRIGAYVEFDWNGAYRTPYQRDMRKFSVQPTTRWVGAKYATLGLGYGISDELTIAGEYVGGTKVTSAAYDPFTDHLDIDRSYDGSVTIFGAYRLAHAARYSVAATMSVVQEFDPNRSGIAAGITARYRLTPRIAVFTGASPIAPTTSTKAFLRSDGRKSIGGAAGVELQWSRRFYMNVLMDSSYVIAPDPSYRVSLHLQTLVTITRNIDIGAYLGEYDVGLETHMTL
jgi:hypothetical protein